MSEYNYREWYVFGDSLCKGIVYDQEEDKHVILQNNFLNLLAEKLHLTIKNYSVFGATINKGLKMFARNERKILHPGIALIEFGGNDCDFLWSEVAEDPDLEHQPNTPLADFYTAYYQLITAVQSKNLWPILISLPPLVEDRYFNFFSRGLDKPNLLQFLGGSPKRIYQWHESYNAEIPVPARATDAKFLDLRKAFLIEKNPERFVCEDGIHPNAQGHQFIANFLIKELSPLFES